MIDMCLPPCYPLNSTGHLLPFEVLIQKRTKENLLAYSKCAVVFVLRAQGFRAYALVTQAVQHPSNMASTGHDPRVHGEWQTLHGCSVFFTLPGSY